MKLIFCATCAFLLSITHFANSQTNGKPNSPSDFFPKERARVLTVGTFHFDYPNLDVNKIDEENKIDVLKEPKKSEVTEIVEHIKKFKPTKIAIEALPSWKAGERFRRYKKGEFQTQRDERYQLGFRLARDLQLDTIYSIDAGSFSDDLEKLDSAYAKKLFADYDFKSSDKYDKMFTEWFDYEQKLPAKMNLLDYLKRTNTRESLQLNYGAYLVGDFKLDKQRGADILSLWWYNRNMRIFRKIQEITTSEQDRILVIFGNGHVSILNQLLESSPEFDLVEFDSLK
ncbi:DUF5694 domain-containing protein [Daejeonella lutea]|uniref:TraB family protein n=1 Tax=Daejeonella lutea TaxID=572036 RepID=A0A1T5BRL3_9SPHI|nr:DUF5694 domain-containing protein [Daejeonella lutea]SKB49908.1 hypothetical protein SAMN05661099_1661 [Daejeonella lutea]